MALPDPFGTVKNGDYERGSIRCAESSLDRTRWRGRRRGFRCVLNHLKSVIKP